jgi:hypothetical protein
MQAPYFSSVISNVAGYQGLSGYSRHPRCHLLRSAPYGSELLPWASVEKLRGTGSHSQIQALRTKSETAMTNYLHDVTREYKLQAGDSIVRAFNVHNARYFSIEQEITIAVKKLNSKWVALILTDAGRDLGSGPEGPWRADRAREPPRKSPFLPTVQYFPDVAAKNLSEYAIPELHQSRGPFAQSASVLAKHYGLTLDPSLFAADSFYALTEVFQSSANSIC